MLYLILAIIASTLVTVVMRLGQRYTKTQLPVLAVNYLVCAGMALLYLDRPLDFTSQGGGFAIGLGLFNGAVYLAGFLLLQKNLRINGVALPATFMKMGVIVPTLMSVIVFKEGMTLPKALGLATALAAIWIIGSEKGSKRAKSFGWLLILLVAGGFTDGTAKIYTELGNPELQDPFLVITFFAALTLTVALCIIRRRKLGWAELGFGLALGVPNYFCARFLLLASAELDGVVMYPTFSVGTIIGVTLAGCLLFKEKLSRRQLTALGIILVALALLNLK